MQIYFKLKNEAYESFMDFVKQILQHAQTFGSKSSILSIFTWMMAILLAALTISGLTNPKEWVIVGIFSMLFILFLSVLVAFFFCLFTGKTDLLRSEKYNIEKIAIEKQSSSDNLIDVHPTPLGHPKGGNIIEAVQEDQSEA